MKSNTSRSLNRQRGNIPIFIWKRTQPEPPHAWRNSISKARLYNTHINEDKRIGSLFLKAKPDRRYPQMSQLIDWLVNLAKQAGTYGLIHGDFNATNIKLNTPQIRLFDFDDCGYHWYAYDIANAIYMFLFDHRNEALHKVSAFADTFLSAYETYRPVNHEEVNQFISYRVCLLNTWLNRPNQAPLVIRTSSQKWITDLKTFVDDYFSRLIHTIKF